MLMTCLLPTGQGPPFPSLYRAAIGPKPSERLRFYH